MTDQSRTAEEIIEKVIRPCIQSHHGDIRIVSTGGDCAAVNLIGNCSGCPSADTGTRRFMEKVLTRELGRPFRVTIVNTVSDDLLDFARTILHGENSVNSGGRTETAARNR